MTTRREARERALAIAYEADARSVGFEEALNNSIAVDAYTEILLHGVAKNEAEIDARIAAAAEHWSPERMAVVDHAILRIAAYELGWELELSTAVIINEAVELAKQYSTDESPAFINGVLAKIAEGRPDDSAG